MASVNQPRPTDPTAARARPGRASVRMYRQGLGDCFLVTLPRRDGRAWRMLIDCGVLLGTRGAEQRLGEVVTNLARDAEGRVDVLVVTHEHYDHVAAFAEIPERFCAAEASPSPGQLQIGEVWFAWTEDPRDPLGRKLSGARAAQVNRLTAMLGQLRLRGGLSPLRQQVADGVAGLIGFFGVDGRQPEPGGGQSEGQAAAAAGARAPRHPGATARAMANARALGGANGEAVRYWKPGDPPWTSADLPGVRIYVLGPPRDEALLKKAYASDEVYHLAASEAANAAFFGAAGFEDPAAAGGDDRWLPFDDAFARALGDPASGGGSAMPETTADFLQRHYYGPGSDMGDQDQSWRRIDEDWLGSAAQFALDLDRATNNTSLVLAVELLPGGEVLLFPADAQVGNWLSWQRLRWTLDGDRVVTATELLNRTVLYKVGHHGSHNATLREQGLELMPRGLAALLPVDRKTAIERRWNGMPLPGLITALAQHDGAVARLDEALPADPRFRASEERGDPEAGIDGPLYYEWRLDP